MNRRKIELGYIDTMTPSIDNTFIVVLHDGLLIYGSIVGIFGGDLILSQSLAQIDFQTTLRNKLK